MISIPFIKITIDTRVISVRIFGKGYQGENTKGHVTLLIQVI